MDDSRKQRRPGPELAATAVSGVHGAEQECEVGRYGLRFQTQRKIASGGMASIVHAFDPLLSRHVAVKALHTALAQQPGEVDAFLREARVTAQLEHPNIVPVYDFCSDASGDWACFAMKLVQGESLGEQIAELGPRRLAPDRLRAFLEVMLKVCDAISYAHSRGVLHLDLKPENIMIGSYGQVYVMDWGIAVRCKVAESGRLVPCERHASMRGTLAYMAPEQLDCELVDVDERTDVYGLGATLYELLTGQPPFDANGTDDVERLRRHIVPDPAPVAAPSELPPGLVQVAMRALARRPDDRYESVAALRSDLAHLVRGGGWIPLQKFEAGALIVREGEAAREAYLLVEGHCDVYKRSGPDRMHLRCMGPGDVFGETAIFASGTRTATVRAKTRVTVLVVTREALERELAGIGALGSFVRALAERFREADDERALLRARLATLEAGE